MPLLCKHNYNAKKSTMVVDKKNSDLLRCVICEKRQWVWIV